VGREFDVGLLQRAAEQPAATVLAQIDAATSLGVVEEHDAAGAFRFTHALIREMLYGELRPAARAELHRRVAMALEAAHPGGHGAVRGAGDPLLPRGAARHRRAGVRLRDARRAAPPPRCRRTATR
jgi:hypothetical protein